MSDGSELPRLITVRQEIREQIERWKKPYWEHGKFRLPDCYDAVCALDPETATGEDLKRATGTLSNWCEIYCDNCSKSVESAVIIGVDGESTICRDCITAASKLFLEQDR